MNVSESSSLSHAQLVKTIAESDAHLESLFKTRESLLSELERIESQLQHETAKRGRLLNLLTPVSQLPPELLSSIFLECYESSTSFPNIASHVCSYWRAVSTSTPLLWANIHVSLKPNDVRRAASATTLHKLGTYLDRTGTGHFKARVEVNGDHDLSKIVQPIAAHMDRCIYLYFSIANDSHAIQTLRHCLMSVDAPVLEYLSMTVRPSRKMYYESDQFDAVLPTIFTGGASVLSFLRLTGIAGTLQPPLVNVNTLCIDGIYMDRLTLTQYRNLLVGLPHLVNLSLVEIGVIDTDSKPLEPVSLPSLRSVRLRNEPETETVRFLLGCLPVEQLECLVLLHVDHLGSSVFSKVEELTFSTCDFPVEQLGHLMLAFPVVKSFTTEKISSMLLLALGYPGVPVWWPHLKFLTVREIQPEEVTSLVEMVRSRKGFGHPLTKVCLDKRSGTLLQKKNLLEELQSMVSVELRHDDPEPWPAGLGYDDEDDGFWSPY
ncbi:hypothetical protein VKT23_011195 [Stygiomarasmius scandens]|uniref:F-box domain-containing protein n=1 Tax=Marasmiellus scandens TaxID=2682957 RepID=A0ABR1JCV9_9AGAR